MKTSLVLSALAPIALLSGCISFGAKPPPSLLTLTPAAPAPIGRTETATPGHTMTVNVPAVPQEIAVQRVPVQATDTSVAYVKDAQWVEEPAKLFARLLADTITAKTDWVVLGNEQTRVDPGTRLTGELRQFGVDAGTHEAVVTYDAALLRSGATGVEKRRFEARVPVASITAAPVGAALNQAANQVAAEVADWVGK
ncbi:MAG TPA: ABC-type transport auxiliary lipoprotein family protein [Sphingomonas sp.]|nr:ABC-type transport auxiliary lipoprotein family protein [Sphingomonas sp.]